MEGGALKGNERNLFFFFSEEKTCHFIRHESKQISSWT